MEVPTQRVSLGVVYNGTNYCGWQIQPYDVSVQSKLERVLSMPFRQLILVTGAGCADAGVHICSMTAHADLLTPHLPLAQIWRGLYDILHGSTSVRSIMPATPTAYTCFDATSRKHHYYIPACSNSFWGDYCQERHTLPDMELMNEACRHFIGEHDFTSFSKLHTQMEHDHYTVYTAHQEQVKMSDLWDTMRHEVCANRFLYGMVRTMVGTLLEVGYEQRTPDSIVELIQREDRTLAGSTTPAHMLFFVEATYPDSIYSLDPQ